MGPVLAVQLCWSGKRSNCSDHDEKTTHLRKESTLPLVASTIGSGEDSAEGSKGGSFTGRAGGLQLLRCGSFAFEAGRL